MKFPTFVYRDKGEFQRNGGTYSYALVNNESEMEEKLADGWYSTLPEAIDGRKRQTDIPPRAQLEKDAESLGVKFNKRTSDETLIERINEALGN